jgi:hypothetical protein
MTAIFTGFRPLCWTGKIISYSRQDNTVATEIATTGIIPPSEPTGIRTDEWVPASIVPSKATQPGKFPGLTSVPTPSPTNDEDPDCLPGLTFQSLVTAFNPEESDPLYEDEATSIAAEEPEITCLPDVPDCMDHEPTIITVGSEWTFTGEPRPTEWTTLMRSRQLDRMKFL